MYSMRLQSITSDSIEIHSQLHFEMQQVTKSVTYTSFTHIHIGSTIGLGETEGGSATITSARGSTVVTLTDISREWPEAFTIFLKLATGQKLSDSDLKWVRAIAEAGGWDLRDTIEELARLDVDPLSRTERYRFLFEKYLSEAQECKRRGDTRHAAEKLWGAVTALIKLYAAVKGVPVVHWSMSKLDHFVEKNVERRHRKLFRDLLDKAHVLHEHFYEGHLSPEGFEERWREVIELLDRAKEIVYKALTRSTAGH